MQELMRTGFYAALPDLGPGGRALVVRVLCTGRAEDLEGLWTYHDVNVEQIRDFAGHLHAFPDLDPETQGALLRFARASLDEARLLLLDEGPDFALDFHLGLPRPQED